MSVVRLKYTELCLSSFVLTPAATLYVAIIKEPICIRKKKTEEKYNIYGCITSSSIIITTINGVQVII